MASVSDDFTGTGNGTALDVTSRTRFNFALTGTWVGTMVLKKSMDGGSTYTTVATKNGPCSGVYQDTDTRLASNTVKYRWTCSAYTSGTITATASNITEAVAGEGDQEVRDDLLVRGDLTVDGSVTTGGVAVVTATGTQTLTNKTLTAPVLGGSVTGTYTLAGTPTITAPAITTPTITGPVTSTPTATDAALGAVAGAGVAVAIDRFGPYFRLKFTLTAAQIPVTDAAGSGSFGALKIFDFAEGAILPLTCVQKYTAFAEGAALTGAAGDASFLIGVGSTAITVAADKALANAEKNLGSAVDVTLSGGTGTGSAFDYANAGAGLDGTATPVDVYLNWSGSAATIDANSTIDVTGTIVIVGVMLGDF